MVETKRKHDVTTASIGHKAGDIGKRQKLST